MQVTTIQPNSLHPRYKNSHCSLMRLITSQPFRSSGDDSKEAAAAMEQKPPSSSLLLVVLLAIAIATLCAGPGHATRLLNDANGGDLEFSFGSKAATAGAESETEPLDTSLGDDYTEGNEISHVEFEPELGSTAPYTYPYAAATAPVPAATTTVDAAAPGPATETEPVTVKSARNGATATAAAGSRSMKWWLPPSTMPSFPLFPNPGGMPMPAIPGLPMPGMPTMPFHPIGGWAAPAPPAIYIPPAPEQPAPPAGATEAAAASTNGNEPNTSGGGVN